MQNGKIIKIEVEPLWIMSPFKDLWPVKVWNFFFRFHNHMWSFFSYSIFINEKLKKKVFDFKNFVSRVLALCKHKLKLYFAFLSRCCCVVHHLEKKLQFENSFPFRFRLNQNHDDVVVTTTTKIIIKKINLNTFFYCLTRRFQHSTRNEVFKKIEHKLTLALGVISSC